MSQQYVDEDYYKNEYGGEKVLDTNFPRFAKRASDIVDQLTEYLIPKIGLENLAEHSQELIKKATCAQIEYFQVEGLESNITGMSSSSESVAIGSFRYGNASSSGQSNRQKNRVAPSCIAYLEGTGLLRRRGGRVGYI